MNDYTLDRDVVMKKMCQAQRDSFNCGTHCKFRPEKSHIYCDAIDVLFDRLMEDGLESIITREE